MVDKKNIERKHSGTKQTGNTQSIDKDVQSSSTNDTKNNGRGEVETCSPMKSFNIFLDSGAHSLYKAEVAAKKKDDFSFYESDSFWEYVERYCEFLKANKDKFEVYVSVDVIFNPEMSWKVQKYMEDTHKLKPLPVFHSGEDFKWLKLYLDNYDYIGLGGLGQSVSKGNWILNVGEPAWNLICNKKGYPRVKVHGFAMTSPDLIIEFPYYSVDSTSWMQFGKYGLIVVPRKKRGKFIYDEPPYIVSVSTRKEQKSEYKNFHNMPKIEQTHVHEYLEKLGLKMGESKLNHVAFDRKKIEFPISDVEVSSVETIITKGVCNDADQRDLVNLQYYLDLESEIPKWPRPWVKKRVAMMTKLPGA